MLVIYAFYLDYFTLLTITFETYNNIDSKTEALFTLQNIKSHNESIVFFKKNQKIKDPHREKALPNKTPALTKNTNMDIWVVGTANQLFIRGSSVP